LTKLLRIDASSRRHSSHSRELSDYFEKLWREKYPDSQVVVRDVAKEQIPHISDETIVGFYTSPDKFTPQLKAVTALSDTLIAELKSADVLLIGAPIYNFSVPSALKAYIDHIVRANYTFAYDGTQFTGLVSNKRAFVCLAYGASGYTGGSLQPFDYLRSYLNLLLNFLGINDITFFSVEGTTTDPLSFESTRQKALAEIKQTLS